MYNPSTVTCVHVKLKPMKKSDFRYEPVHRFIGNIKVTLVGDNKVLRVECLWKSGKKTMMMFPVKDLFSVEEETFNDV